ncbi:hypothetical protein I0C86_00010 [Plantactinospora sp. S1510]|uniref:Uncharacterized protein n=1 Tax=Plantactinospora alkalitolerans TaxID=2789879 RepID=A0ABS0GMG3_9ACTN|nr:hypothetical protein [Plantactinospora alkalitolerans]MBF9127386.1 hypothetical protein [Plantactinospora alkalitolerans]
MRPVATSWCALPDLVETAMRVGDTARARPIPPGLTDWATYIRSPVPSALLLRRQALLDDGGLAYREPSRPGAGYW